MVPIPSSENCVNVSIIDATIKVAFPLALFAQPAITGNETVEIVYCFYIEHPTLKKSAVFDLGFRKDFHNLAPKHANLLAQTGWVTEVKEDVSEILQRHDIANIDSIVWSFYSHPHLDHMGDPSTFPSTTELVVGPGFSATFLPGYPLNPDGDVLESDYANRPLREVTFNIEIGGMPAYDFFGDGSFYLLDAPGHEIGHMCGLARTTPDNFILMGADACHHPGMIRPNSSSPLPDRVLTSCGALLCDHILPIHPEHSGTRPFYTFALRPDGTAVMFKDVFAAQKTLECVQAFDADERVLVVQAHDHSLRGIIEPFPAWANHWAKKGWKEKAKWEFLSQFQLDDRKAAPKRQ